MSLSGHLKWGVIATLAVTLSGGCIPYPRERPGYIDLCKSEYEFSIDSPVGKKDIIIETYLYDHAIPGNYMPQKRSYFTIPFVQGPEARPEFYVQLVAWNKGQPPVPIMLDTRKGWIDLGDGKRLSARPDVFLGTTSFPYDFPGDNMKYAGLHLMTSTVMKCTVMSPGSRITMIMGQRMSYLKFIKNMQT
ncbi:hypothetical protein ACVRUF_001968 [Cronobacter turicensis]